MANWQQYKTFMPLGMQKLFEGVYFWKMPPDVQLDIGPTIHNFLPKSYRDATEKYSPQTSMKILPNGHYVLQNYHGGTPFPNPQEPNKGWKILADIFFAYQPSMYVNTPDNPGLVWAVDRYGNASETVEDVVYRYSDYNTDPHFQQPLTYAPGTWYTEWIMIEQPEQARYTASLNLFYTDQESRPFPDTYVFVPTLRRTLRLSSTARCSPIFGYDWAYDDAKTNGFNGSTSIYTGDFLGDRNLVTLAHFKIEAGAAFPGNYSMPLGFPKPSWGKWEVRQMAVDDIHRIPSEAAGYCYSSRIAYADREHWNSDWTDLFDSNRKLWKSISWYNDGSDNVPNIGQSWNGVSSTAMDFQNEHETIYSSKFQPYLGINVPKQYQDGTRYGSPTGLSMINR
jgi:hypothetical protein